MQVTVNGESRELSDDTTVAHLIEALGLAEVPVVVQRNDEIVNRDRYAETALADGDVLELVRFVGGG